MENERVLYAHENGPGQGFRLFVTGEVDRRLIDVLKAFVEFQEKVMASPVGGQIQPEVGHPEAWQPEVGQAEIAQPGVV